MAAKATRTALVTGANRGIGLEVCRQLAAKGLRVVLTARERPDAERAAKDIEGAHAEELDVAQEGAARACAERLKRAKIHVDVLINNAGVYPQGDFLSTPPDVWRQAFDVHVFGTIATCQAFVPDMLRAKYGRVVNVSSGYGQISEGLEGPAAYSVSKAALNALTIKLASQVRGDVKVNSACPGWVRTRMGGAGADLSVEEGADTIVWLATLPASGPSGGFFRERRTIAW
jgi:NAD(P)-dependent dehydrogenase (short-subunit alcohol dehydrogenase family)